MLHSTRKGCISTKKKKSTRKGCISTTKKKKKKVQEKDVFLKFSQID